jgi:hypothetical protein
MPSNPLRQSRPIRVLLGALAGTCLLALAHAQEAPSPASALFATEAPLQIRLEAPFGAIQRDHDKPEYHPARLVYSGPGGADVSLDLKVRSRGKSRSQVCGFPPLLLDFPAKAVAGTVFEGQNKLKLVTHCQADRAYESYLRIEYLVYKIQALLTDLTLHVRLVDATYYDSERGRVVATKPGFIIEAEDLFAKRQGLTLIKEEHLDRGRYDPAALRFVETFQFFIGNPDWSAFAGPKGDVCCHNVVPMARADGMLVPVPYDFDSTGIVDPPYAAPAVGLPIRDVRTRLYFGPCRSLDDLKASFEPFEKNRVAIEALFGNTPNLGSWGANARRFVDDFYAIVADPQRVERAFRSRCPK